jgi:hypothetical protein
LILNLLNRLRGDTKILDETYEYLEEILNERKYTENI